MSERRTGYTIRMKEIFGNTFTTERILAVGASCNFDDNKCVEMLLKESVDDGDVVMENESYYAEPVTIDSLRQAPSSYYDQRSNEPSQSFPHHRQFQYTDKRQQSNDAHYNRIAQHIRDGYKILVLMRGLPGSGKSTLAKKLITDCELRPTEHIISADDFFVDKFGIYRFDMTRLGDAHDDCKHRTETKMAKNFSPIVIDNTNIKLWEMETYCQLAIPNGYSVHILEPSTAWAFRPEECAWRTTHTVPLEKLQHMRKNYERVKNGRDLLEAFHLPTRVQMQLRAEPPLSFDERKYLPPNDYNMQQQQRQQQRQQRNSPQQRGGNDKVDSRVMEKFNWSAIQAEVNQYWQENLVPEQPDPRTTSEISAQAKEQTIALQNQLLSTLKDDTQRKSNSEEPMTDSFVAKRSPALQKHRKGCRNENEAFCDMRMIYPQVGIDYLWDLFEKCDGDANWMMNILFNENIRETDEPSNPDEDFSCTCDDGCWGESRVAHPDVQSDIPVEKRLREDSMQTTPQRQQYRKKKTNQKFFSAESEEIKRQIEGSVVIGDEFYTDHMKQVRSWKRPQPRSEITLQNYAVMDGPKAEQSNDPGEIKEVDEILEMNLGADFIGQLESEFNCHGMEFKTFKPTVFMPKSLAKQIYHLWIESMFNQMEEQRLAQIDDDEEIAKLLQSSNAMEEKTPQVRLEDLAQMQYTLAQYTAQSGGNEWIQGGPDLAAKLNRLKLYETFPGVEKEMIDDILEQNDNKYSDVVDMLKQTLDYSLDDTFKEQQSKLLMAAKFESDSIPKTIPPTTSLVDKVTAKSGTAIKTTVDAKRDALRDFEENRNKAMHHNQLKLECYQKTKEALQKRNGSIAAYYSQIANLHKYKVDHFNHLAANSIVSVHDLTHQNSEILDLHYLLVQEALPCLEVFLDSHITRLRSKKQTYKHVFLITGRGLHSAGGIATIKVNVKNYLQTRGLCCSEVNPGLLKVRIYNKSKLTTMRTRDE